MSTDHADQHDLDKLARWRRDLSDGDSDRFPVYCVFLVSPEDRASHDVFRRFRSSFEERAAGYQHLMIFGQHGISSTLRALLPEFGLTLQQVPTLALLTTPSVSTVHTMALAQGAEPGQEEEEEPWQTVLSLVEGVADRREKVVELASLAELKSHPLSGATLPEVVARVLARLS
jgi:hypothetical protein